MTRWDGTDERGTRLASGVYLIRFRLRPEGAGAMEEQRIARAVLQH